MSKREFERIVEQIDPPFWKEPVGSDYDIDKMIEDQLIEDGEIDCPIDPWGDD